MIEKFDFTIANLGERRVASPIWLSILTGDSLANYVTDEEFIRYSVDVQKREGDGTTISELLERAGPREKLYFSPSHVHAAIVTCGGLCPGINDVIRSIVRCLWFRYGVRRITGVRFGYRGLLPEYGIEPKDLNPDEVDDIHKIGGSVLGTSRGGGEKVGEIVDSIESMNINVLFAIGGDGTQKGALAISEEIMKRGMKISVIGVPKTIDNDLSFIDRSFGFETAVSKAAEAVSGAHTEAHSSMNGIGLVRLMGRESGFIAVHTVLAVHEANFVLIPEVPFALEGENGLLALLEKRLAKSNHALIVVAEGAGQEQLPEENSTDASGNKKFGDIGVYLRERILMYFTEKKIEVNIKYIDPSYMIRSAPAIPTDSAYCERLGNNAAHAAMAGKTQVLIGLVNNEFVHIPMGVAVARRKKVDPEGTLWRDAVDATQQPLQIFNS